jgi:hypothetical protein
MAVESAQNPPELTPQGSFARLEPNIITLSPLVYSSHFSYAPLYANSAANVRSAAVRLTECA